MRKIFVVFLLVFMISTLYSTGVVDNVKKNIKTFTLKNGLKFILYEDHSVPIANFVTYANVGASDERVGIYGISHFLEHLAFKGTKVVGTKSYRKERKILKKMDKVFDSILKEKDSVNPDKKKIEELEKRLLELRKEADKYVISNEFDVILKKNGGVGLNAGTSNDSTIYYFSLPSNRIELWAYLESGRFSNPVFREFYKEREVIKEERRMRTENSPIGKLIEEMLAISFKEQPYHVSVIGPMSNINHIKRSDVREYFKEHYNASNLVIGVAGDVYLEDLKRLAKKYFSKIPKGKKNLLNYTVDPPQLGEKTITLYEDSQPWLIIGYHCPAETDKDFIKFEVFNYIFTAGRSSRLYKKMVVKDKSAMFVGSFAGFPGTKYPSLYIIYTLPNSGHTNKELQNIIFKEIEKLKNNKISNEELISAKKRYLLSQFNAMKSKQSLLISLLRSEVINGSWERAFDFIDEVNKISVKDIQDLVNKYFKKRFRIIARIEKKGGK